MTAQSQIGEHLRIMDRLKPIHRLCLDDKLAVTTMSIRYPQSNVKPPLPRAR
jgi:hypothetical protein